jgi:hypothetical protein
MTVSNEPSRTSPTQVFAATNDLRGAVFNPLYSIDVRLARPAG